MGRVQDKVVLVTGGSGGIGAATVREPVLRDIIRKLGKQS